MRFWRIANVGARNARRIDGRCTKSRKRPAVLAGLTVGVRGAIGNQREEWSNDAQDRYVLDSRGIRASRRVSALKLPDPQHGATGKSGGNQIMKIKLAILSLVILTLSACAQITVPLGEQGKFGCITVGYIPPDNLPHWNNSTINDK